jgi:hypothetical protein
MENELINADTELKITASKTSSQHDFDFFFGKWKIRNKKLKSRLDNCTDWIEFEAHQECYAILQGFGNTDHFHAEFEGFPFEGMTLRLFNPQTKLWSIYWVDSNVVVLDVPQIGSFDGNIGKFFAKDTFNGKEIIVQFLWDKTDANAPVWSQAFSADNGKTWEWNWYMYMERKTNNYEKI